MKKLIFTPDGRYLLAAGDEMVRVWDVKTSQLVRSIRLQVGSLPESYIAAAAFSPDGRLLALGGRLKGASSGTTIFLIDYPTGENLDVLAAPEEGVGALSFSPDGRRLAANCYVGYGGVLRVWDVGTPNRRLIQELPSSEAIHSIAFSPNSHRLVSGTIGAIQIWDLEAGRLVREMEGPNGEVRGLAYSRDGRFLVTGGEDGAVQLWDAASGDFVRTLGHQARGVSQLVFTADGRRLVSSPGEEDAGYMCFVLSFPGGDALPSCKDLGGVFSAVAISPDGDLVAGAGAIGRNVFLVSLNTGETVTRFPVPGEPIWSVGFGADGRSVRFGQSLRNRSSNRRGPLERAVVLHGESEAGVSIVDAPPGAAIEALETLGDLHVSLRHGTAGTVLEVSRGSQVVRVIGSAETSAFDHRSFSLTPDGKSIVSGGSDGALRIYDVATGGLTRKLVGHTQDVWAVAVSADGRSIVSGSEDQTVRLWDVPTGENRLTVFPAPGGEWVAWTPYGYYASSLNGDRYIQWEIDRGPAQGHYSAGLFQTQYYRSDVVAEYVLNGNIQAALASANQRRGIPSPVMASVESILPPLIHVYSPKESQVVGQQELHVQMAALSANLPITELRVLLNGTQIAGAQEGRSPGKAREREVELEVTLRPGENVLTFMAAHESARSEPVERRVTYRPPTGKSAAIEKPDLMLLAIGISDYSDPSLKLSYASADAQAIAVALGKQRRGRIFGEIRSRILPAAGGRAGRAEILDGLKWLRTEGTPRDVRVIFLSGHGGLDDRRNFYFFSQDQKLSEDLELNSLRADRLLEDLVAARSPAILMIDACHAGSADSPPRGRTDLTEVIKILRERFQLVTFAASTGNELSIERTEWGHGAFTKALLEGLSGTADGFGGDKDGRIEVKELGAWVIDRVPKLTAGSQHALFDPGWVDVSFPISALEEERP